MTNFKAIFVQVSEKEMDKIRYMISLYVLCILILDLRCPHELLRLSQTTILDSSKLKAVVNDKFKFDENCGKFSKWIENTVGKGEIALYKQFFLYPQSFQKTCIADTKKSELVWDRVNALSKDMISSLPKL